MESQTEAKQYLYHHKMEQAIIFVAIDSETMEQELLSCTGALKN